MAIRLYIRWSQRDSLDRPGAQPREHDLARHLEQIKRNPRVESVPDVETLRHNVEREGDQGLVVRFGRHRVRQRSCQQFVADAASLLTGSHKQFREKPQAVAEPTEGEAKHLAPLLSDPKAAGIVAQGKRLEMWRPRRCHRPKTVPLRQVVDAASNQFLGARQFLLARGPVVDNHRTTPGRKTGTINPVAAPSCRPDRRGHRQGRKRGTYLQRTILRKPGRRYPARRCRRRRPAG